MTDRRTRRGTRAERLAMPLARNVVKDLAAEHGACLRPVQLRRTDDRHRLRRAGPRPLRAHPGLGLPAVRRTGQDPAGRPMPRRLAPRPRTGHRPGPGRPASSGPWSPTAPRRKPTGTPSPTRASTPPTWTSGSASWTSRSPRPGCAATSCPHRPRRHRSTRRQAGRRAAAPPPGQQPDGRQDLHRAGRQDLPAVAVRHADLPVLRPGRRGRSTRRPGHLRLHPGRPGRAALRRAVRPVHPEPAPLRRL